MLYRLVGDQDNVQFDLVDPAERAFVFGRIPIRLSLLEQPGGSGGNSSTTSKNASSSESMATSSALIASKIVSQSATTPSLLGSTTSDSSSKEQPVLDDPNQIELGHIEFDVKRTVTPG